VSERLDEACEDGTVERVTGDYVSFEGKIGEVGAFED
jgi:hypothetical protein